MHIPTLIRQIKALIILNIGSTLTRRDYQDSGCLPHEVLLRCRVEGRQYPDTHPLTALGGHPNPPPPLADDYKNYQGIEKSRKEELNSQQAALYGNFFYRRHGETSSQWIQES